VTWVVLGRNPLRVLYAVGLRQTAARTLLVCPFATLAINHGVVGPCRAALRAQFDPTPPPRAEMNSTAAARRIVTT